MCENEFFRNILVLLFEFLPTVQLNNLFIVFFIHLKNRSLVPVRKNNIYLVTVHHKSGSVRKTIFISDKKVLHHLKVIKEKNLFLSLFDQIRSFFCGNAKTYFFKEKAPKSM